jgi:hypothetical protein
VILEIDDVEVWLLRQAVFRHKVAMSDDDSKGLSEQAIVVLQNCYARLDALEQRLRDIDKA